MDLQLCLGLVVKPKQLLLGAGLLNMMNTSSQGLALHWAESFGVMDLQLFLGLVVRPKQLFGTWTTTHYVH